VKGACRCACIRGRENRKNAATHNWRYRGTRSLFVPKWCWLLGTPSRSRPERISMGRLAESTRSTKHCVLYWALCQFESVPGDGLPEVAVVLTFTSDIVIAAVTTPAHLDVSVGYQRCCSPIARTRAGTRASARGTEEEREPSGSSGPSRDSRLGPLGLRVKAPLR
jgi:hypothetical protein